MGQQVDVAAGGIIAFVDVSKGRRVVEIGIDMVLVTNIQSILAVPKMNAKKRRLREHPTTDETVSKPKAKTSRLQYIQNQNVIKKLSRSQNRLKYACMIVLMSGTAPTTGRF